MAKTCDNDFGEIAEVLWAGLDFVRIKLSPFGGGVKRQREILTTTFEILTPLEVIAEAARG